MHGTDALYGPFAEQLDRGLAPHAVRYPVTRGLTYEQYADIVRVPDGSFGIVAESFSGPIGVLLAARYRERVRGLVLAATFVRAPAMARVAALVPAFAFRTPPPAFVLRAALLGDDADAQSVARLKSVLRGTPPQVIAERLRLVAGVNVSSALAGCTTPVLHIEAARDRLLSREDGSAIREACRDCAHHAIDAPHLVLQRSPEEAASRVSAHFRA